MKIKMAQAWYAYSALPDILEGDFNTRYKARRSEERRVGKECM